MNTLNLIFGASRFGKGAQRLCGSSVADELWDGFVDILPEGAEGLSDADGVLSGIGIDSVLEAIFSAIGEGIGGVVSFFAMLMGLAMLMALAGIFGEGSAGSGRLASLGIAAVSALAVFRYLSPLFEEIGESLDMLGDFFSSLIPVLTGISAAAGGMNTAAAEALNMNMTLGIVAYAADRFLLPLALAMFSLSLAGGIDGGGLASVAKGVKGLFMWGLGIGTAVILGAVSMQSLLASAKDTAYLRAAKYAASGIIPVVGGTVSSALGSLGGALSYIKGAVGVASVAVIVAAALSPLVTLLLFRLALSAAVSFLEFVGESAGVRIYCSYRAAVDALTAVYVISILVYICEIVIFVKSGVNAFA